MRPSRTPCPAGPRRPDRALRPALAGVLVALLVALLAAACANPGSGPGASASPSSPAGVGAGGASVIPLIVSTQQAVGPNRFVFGFLDAATNLPAAEPGRSASVAFTAPGSSEPGPPVEAEFVWAIEGSRGVYVARTDFPGPGDWQAEFRTRAEGAAEERVSVSFQVTEDPIPVAVGEPAPASDTPTADDVGGDLSRLSTDASPDPDFYRRSVADALEEGRPFVLVFATPAFCQSAQCGPTLDRVKAAAAGAPDEVEFINVEPYQLSVQEGALQPELDGDGRLQPVPAVLEWGILTEPWIFTVDASGIVRGSFEGVIGDRELSEAIAEIAG